MQMRLFLRSRFRHLQKLWGASGDFWQSQWEKVYEWFEGNEFSMAVWGKAINGQGLHRFPGQVCRVRSDPQSLRHPQGLITQTFFRYRIRHPVSLLVSEPFLHLPRLHRSPEKFAEIQGSRRTKHAGKDVLAS